ncbi:MAG: hypothetical protein HYR60_25725 [Acidobacteria bacterium]|nr:hypothetical protein [Acidobacteriota bacterium]
MIPLMLFAALLAAEKGPQLKCPATLAEGGGKTQRPLLYVTFYNGKQGGQEYELAPDDEIRKGKKVTQIWSLKSYKDMPLFVRCRYAGTQATTAVEVPEAITLCNFRFELDPKGEVLKPTLECK